MRLGFTHGHTIIPQGDADALLIAARQMDVDVLLWGGTHKFEAYELEGKFFVNPGSATGAFSTNWQEDGEEPTPSFCLMDVGWLVELTMVKILTLYQVQGDVLVLYVYQLRTDANGNENVAVEKVSYRRPTPPTTTWATANETAESWWYSEPKNSIQGMAIRKTDWLTLWGQQQRVLTQRCRVSAWLLKGLTFLLLPSFMLHLVGHNYDSQAAEWFRQLGGELAGFHIT